MFQKKTHNKKVKNARYHSLGLLKSGAALCFLKAPYFSRYALMKRLITFLLFFLVSGSAYTGESGAEFTITSDCVASIEVKKSRFVDAWDIEITLNEVAGKKLFNVSSKNIFKKLTMVDGNNHVVYEAVVRGGFSSIFVISGIENEKEALRAKKSVLESTGECGEKK